MNFSINSVRFFVRFGIFFMVLLIAQCKKANKVEEKIQKIPVQIQLERFDKAFAETNASSLPSLKKEYPFLFNARYADSVWVQRLEDTIQQEINKEIARVFEDTAEIEKELKSFYQHLLYYFPKSKVPHVVTISNYVRYKERLWLDKDYLFVALDNYLGVSHQFYQGFPKFVRAELHKGQIVVDLANLYVRNMLVGRRGRSFVEKVIQYGKELYLMQALLPSKSAASLLGYTEQEWIWAEENESQIWRYFIEKELWYDTGTKLDQRFLNPAPFSKFYLELDSESPGKIGRFLGWKIVQAYMEDHQNDFVHLMQKDNDGIFQESRYKPKKN